MTSIRLFDNHFKGSTVSSSFIDFRVRPAGSEDTIEVPARDEHYARVYKSKFAADRGISALIGDLEAHDGLAVMQAEWEDDDPVAVNELVAQAVRTHPDRLVAGIATTDPRLPNALEILRHAHDHLGLRGWNFQPGFLKMAMTDPRCAELFAYCQVNGHPVTVHTGVNFSPTGSIEFGRPLGLCSIACDYPDLVLVANHGGWPWVTEMLAVLWKHPNVYADFGAIAPKRMVGSAGGWEPVAHWMNSMVSDQVLLASDWPMMRHDRLLTEVRLLGLREESLAKYIRGNAVRLLDTMWGTALS
jgi:predicted TIM-barrel fold metal-dependent hydrolase